MRLHDVVLLLLWLVDPASRILALFQSKMRTFSPSMAWADFPILPNLRKQLFITKM